MFPPVSSDYSALSKSLCGVAFCPLKAEPQRLSTLSKATPKKMVKPGFIQNSRNLSCPAVHALSLSRAREFSVLKNGNSASGFSPSAGPGHKRWPQRGMHSNETMFECASLEKVLAQVDDNFLGLVPLWPRLPFLTMRPTCLASQPRCLFPGGPLPRQRILGQMKARLTTATLCPQLSAQ